MNEKLETLRNETFSFRLPVLNEYEIAFFINTTFDKLSEEYQIQLASCFCSVFNETWNEKWTIPSAKKNLRKITSCLDGKPIIGLLLFDRKVTGFIICKLKNVFDINVKDFPYALPMPQKKKSVLRSKYVYETILNAKSLLVIQEIGIAPHEKKSLISKLLSPYLCYPAIKYSHANEASAMLFWTNTSSQAFNWGLSIKWVPFHFYLTSDLVLMQGSTRTFLNSAHKLFPETIRVHAKELQNNKHNYLCKI